MGYEPLISHRIEYSDDGVKHVYLVIFQNVRPGTDNNDRSACEDVVTVVRALHLREIEEIAEKYEPEFVTIVICREDVRAYTSGVIFDFADLVDTSKNPQQIMDNRKMSKDLWVEIDNELKLNICIQHAKGNYEPDPG